jgi:predicted amidohydrolase
MTANLRVTLVQTNLAWLDPAVNREQLLRQLAPLAGQTDLVVLPEMFTTSFTLESATFAEPEEGPTSEWMCDLSGEIGAAVTGSVITRVGTHYFNRLLWATPDGTTSHYDKRHLFRMAGEDLHFRSGGEAIVVPWRGWNICPLVCYDLRFPVFSRRRPSLDFDLLLYVANWPIARHRAWQTLLPARAVENQAYVVGVNRTGTDGKAIEYGGGSSAYDYIGEPLLCMEAQESVATVELKRASLLKFRDRFPMHLDADPFVLVP